MKKNYILGAFAVASLAFTACSSDDLNEEIGSVTPSVPQEQVQNGFQELGDFVLSTPSGVQDGTTASASRSHLDIDEFGRPRGMYPLDSLYVMTVNPGTQPTPDDACKPFNPGYSLTGSKLKQISAFHGLKFYYKLTDLVDNGTDVSASGKILLSTHPDGSDPMEIKLSVFYKDDLKHKEHVFLNSFAYNEGVENVRGTGLRYLSYNPSKLDGYDVSGKGTSSTYEGQYIGLPTIEAEKYPELEFLRGDAHFPEHNMVTETKDAYFMGAEFLFAAIPGEYDNEIYMLKTVETDDEDGGYYLNQKYPIVTEDMRPAEAKSIEMSRMTSMVNASFMIVDGDVWDESSYFVPGNFGETKRNFEQKYQLDLGTLKCPYATFDGINARYFVNNPETRQKRVDMPSRLIMWAPNLKSYCADGDSTYRYAHTSMDLSYYLNEQLQRGFGIKGESHSVIYPGYSSDTQNKKLQFYITINDVNVKIIAKSKDGFAFQPNTSHNILVSVDAQSLADKIKALQQPNVLPSRSINDYVELEVPAENVHVIAE